jgi:acetate---CoA ligase (ADP-forming)
MPLDKFFNAKSIAVIGASRTPGHVGNVIVQNLIDSKFPGRIYPINPKADEILNIKTYPSVTKVKEKIDQAVIAVPAKFVLNVIKDCAKKGIKHVIIITAGFGEVGNNKLQRELETLLKKHKITAIGPNCLGTLDTRNNIDTIFIPRERIRRPPTGTLTILSQSGGLGSTLLDLASLESIGINKFVSYGNAVNTDVTELLDYLKDDKSTKAICIYIEGLKDGKAFMKAAKATTKHKPVIVLKGGTTEAGSKVALSHTASLAGSAEVYKGALTQAGCIIAKNYEEFVDLAEIFAKAPKAKGKRTVIITNAGGHAILASDAMENHNLPFAEFSNITRNNIKKYLSNIKAQNPLDLLGDATAEQFKTALQICLKDKSIDIILLFCMPQTPRIHVPTFLKAVREATKDTDKPVICVTSGSSYAEKLKEALENMGLPCYHYPEEAVRAVAKFADYHTRKN